jgi:Rrf2 family nitric oxide-sensitive transcriptional repressor
MQLTRFSDLSLRLLLYLASRGQSHSSVATARATAEIFNVPYTHLVKVVHRLSILGFVTTSKGKGGGLRLSRPAEEIRVGGVLRQTEPAGAIINCFEPPCPLRRDCLLKTALDDAYEVFFRELDRYTLADVAETPSLKRLVQLTLREKSLAANVPYS